MKFEHLNKKTIPIEHPEGLKPEVLETKYIDVSHEEYERMFKNEFISPKNLTLEDLAHDKHNP